MLSRCGLVSSSASASRWTLTWFSSWLCCVWFVLSRCLHPQGSCSFRVHFSVRHFLTSVVFGCTSMSCMCCFLGIDHIGLRPLRRWLSLATPRTPHSGQSLCSGLFIRITCGAVPGKYLKHILSSVHVPIAGFFTMCHHMLTFNCMSGLSMAKYASVPTVFW